MFVMVNSTARTSRLATKASQMINRNIITATNEIRDPIEEMEFQSV